jgi:hypothetical protein
MNQYTNNEIRDDRLKHDMMRLELYQLQYDDRLLHDWGLTAVPINLFK